jgi:zinc protease
MISPPSRTAARPEPSGVIHFPRSTARQHVLPNGLTLLVQEDHSAPVASVQAWVSTGSIHEGAHLGSGLSHLLEHMLFKGTETRSTNQIAQRIQDEGGYINAYTSFERTVYWIDVPKAGIATAIDVLADACMNSTLPADEFVKEQEVIRREFAMVNDDPDRVNSQQLFSAAYREHPYRYPVIGYLDVFNQLTRDQVFAYYKGRYAPNNIAFVVVGDVDADAVLAQLETFFAAHPRQALPPVYLPAEPAQLGRREARREFPTELSRLVLSWHIPGITHPDVPALDVLATALGEGRSSRLYRRLREELGLAHFISAFSYVPSQPGLFGVEATTDPDKREAVEAAAMEMIAEIQREGISAPELAKAKRVLLNNQLNALVTMRGQASDLGSNWLLTGNLDFSRDYLESIQRVEAEDIAHAARVYLRPDRCTVAALDPEGTRKKEAALHPERQAGEIQRFELSNGLRLLVREDARLPLVYLDAVFRGGLLLETPADNGLTRLFSRVLLKGTENRTAEQIAEQIEAVGGSISGDAGNNSFSVSLEVMQPDLELGLDILADTLLHASLPESVIEREKAVQLAAIKAEDEHITGIARNLLRAKMFGDHPYALRSTGSPEALAGLKRQHLVDFQRRLVTAKNCVLSVFGNVKAEDVRERIEALFAVMTPGELALENPPAPAPLTVSVEAEKIEDKEQAVLMISFRGVSIHSEDRCALELIDEASSDLGSRFFVRIREELGLAYFVGSSQLAGLAPGMFTFYVGTDPRKVDLVREAFLGEIAHLAAEGLSEEELTRAKKKFLGKQAISHQSNASLAYTTALDELYNLGYLHYRKMAEEVEKLTLEKVRAVARKYFHNQPTVTAIVRPELPAQPVEPILVGV